MRAHTALTYLIKECLWSTYYLPEVSDTVVNKTVPRPIEFSSLMRETEELTGMSDNRIVNVVEADSFKCSRSI